MNPVFIPDSIDPLVRIAITVPVAYAVIILFIRISGKRSTSQMNNFDWIVTVALGSILGSTVVLKDVTLAEGLLATGLLLALQFVLTTAVRRSDRVASAIKATPTLLLHNGSFIEEAMSRERISEREILAALREKGVTDTEAVAWVVLENDASFSVLLKSDSGNAFNVMREVPGFDERSGNIPSRN
jgi:uncharacterized membrane protein YcaP (DUF421 family)